MNRYYIAGLLFTLVCIAGCMRNSRTKKEETMKWTQLPPLPGAQNNPSLGVSAPFAGIHANRLLVAGGCNFPDKPVAEGGTKKYYKEIFALDVTADTSEWEYVGDLPATVAYGASVTVPKGVVCIGGNNDEGSFKEVILLSWENQQLVKSLPSLPFSRDNFAATGLGNKVYVTGGNENGVPSRTFYCLDMDDTESGWQELSPYTGFLRVQPVLIGQKGIQGPCIYLAGGFQPGSETEAPEIPLDLLIYDIARDTWGAEAVIPSLDGELPCTLTGGFGVAWGDSTILVGGGVNYARFLAAVDRPRQLKIASEKNDIQVIDSLKQEATNYLLHPVEWYRFNSRLLFYNTFTKKWTLSDDYPQTARAGAAIAMFGDDLFVINGELKPGIRTPEVNRLLVLSGNLF